MKTQQTVTVMAAASLTEPFTELGLLYMKKHPDVNLLFNFAGSQALANQIRQGAPADLFASANNKYMNQMVEEGFVLPGTSALFAGNRLVVVLPTDNPAGITNLQDLTKPGVKIVLAAPAVPVGAYTETFLAEAEAQLSAGYQAGFSANVVSYEDNVKTVLTKVRLGEADAGVVYSSDAANAGAEVIIIPIPDAVNPQASYPLAVLADTGQPALAGDFMDFVLSEEGQAVLLRFGFTAP